jgi:hypothetical protein
MSKGDSGRIVIEVEPTLKRQLYSALAMESSTLKDWFIQCAEEYIKREITQSSNKIKQKMGPRL